MNWLIVPPLAFAGVFAAFYFGMTREGQGELPSTFIGREAPVLPETSLPGTPLLTAAGLRTGEVTVVNFWASWCVPCTIEHPQLMQLARDGVPVYGVSYKDKAPEARAFLERRGNPFARLGADATGRVGIEWGVYGVPETYFVDRQGIIRWRWAGPVTPEVVEQDLRPLLRRYA